MKSITIKFISVFVVLCSFLFSCEEDITPDNSNFTSQYVVEAYLEKSAIGLPPYLFLTQSIGFYNSFDTSILNRLFIHDAEVYISTGSTKTKLEEICISTLPQELKREILKRLGLNADSVLVDFCAYIDISNQIPILENANYNLEIYIGKDTLRSNTIIPPFIPLDSLWFEDIPGKGNDSFAQLFCIIDDKLNRKDYYRVFTAGMNEDLIPNNSSVTNDFFFDGQKFKFALNKAQAPDEPFNDQTGYFRRGDSIQIKWCTIDKQQFDFWNTLEVSRTRQGPFSSYVRIKGNIINGLGMFGGQQCEVYKLYVPKK